MRALPDTRALDWGLDGRDCVVLWAPVPGLSILSLLPLISWGDLTPKAVGTWIWEAEGTAMERCGEGTQGGK